MSKEWTRSATVFFAGCFLVVLYLFWRILFPSLTPLAWGAVLYTTCHPLYRVLVRLLGHRRRLAALLTCILISALVIIPAILLVISLAKQSAEAYASIHNLVQSPEFDAKLQGTNVHFTDKLSELIGQDVELAAFDLKAVLLNLLNRVSQLLFATSSAIVGGFAGFVYQFFLTMVTVYFLFIDGRKLLAEAKALIPLPWDHVEAVMLRFHEVSTVTLYGTLLTAISQGGVGALSFAVLGLPSPVFWGATMAAASFIPLVGAGLVWAPAAVYFLLTGSVGRGLVLLVFGVAGISTIDNVVRLYVLKGTMRMHILVLFIRIIGGLKVFGLLGLILGPLVVALLQGFLDIYRHEFPQRATVHKPVVKAQSA